MKKCSKCQIKKSFSFFTFKSKIINRLSSRCKECEKQYRIENKIKLQLRRHNYYIMNKETLSLKKKKYNDSRKKIKAEKDQEYRLKNKEKIKEQRRKTRKTDKFKISRKLYMNKLSNDSSIKLARTLRNRLNIALFRKYKTGSAVTDLGCSIENFKKYLESKFQIGMDWTNKGKYGWHIDHIVPLSKFNLTNREEFLQAVHYTNLQPLWAKDNLSKGKKYESYFNIKN